MWLPTRDCSLADRRKDLVVRLWQQRRVGEVYTQASQCESNGREQGTRQRQQQ